jgi:hypothetical protein
MLFFTQDAKNFTQDARKFTQDACFLTQDACFLTQDAIFRLTMHQVKVHVHEEILCTPGSFALGVFLVVFGV